MVKIRCSKSPEADTFSCLGAKPTVTGTLGVDERPGGPPVTADPVVRKRPWLCMQHPRDLSQLVWSDQDHRMAVLPHSGENGGY